MLWAVLMLLAIGAHPYGALVLGSQGLYVLRDAEPAAPGDRRLRAPSFVLAIPLWRSSLVLANRFDVGVGGGGGEAPHAAARCSPTSGTSPATRPPATRAYSSSCSLLAAVRTRIALARERPQSALLTALRRPHPDALLPRRPLRRELGARVAPPDLRPAVPRARGRRRESSPPRAAPAATARWLAALVVAGARSRSRSPGAGTRRPRCSSARTRSGWTRAAPAADVARRHLTAATTSSSPTSRSTWPPGSATARRLADGRPARRPEARSRDARARRRSRSGAGVLVFDAGDNNNYVKRTHGSSCACRSRAASSRAGRTGRTSSSAPAGRPSRSRTTSTTARKAELIGKSLGMGDADINYATIRPAQVRLLRPLPLQGLLVARRLFERGQARRSAALRAAACGARRRPRRHADQPADQKGAEPAATTTTFIHRTYSASCSIRSAACAQRGAVEDERHRVREVVERRPVQMRRDPAAAFSA